MTRTRTLIEHEEASHRLSAILCRRVHSALSPAIEPPSQSRRRAASSHDFLATYLAEEADPSLTGNQNLGYRCCKRALDLVGALTLLLLLAPLLAIVFVVLSLTTRGQALFRQTRIGRNGEPFTMYKFRTMRPSAMAEQAHVANELSSPVFKNRRDPRITLIGGVLRRLSIDETPQLWNVLRGEMSLVGPRPALAQEVDQYTPRQRQRLAVKPGLTGPWQVGGRCDIPEFDDWIRLDLWYVQRQSFWTDLVLLGKTPWSVLSCRGAY